MLATRNACRRALTNQITLPSRRFYAAGRVIDINDSNWEENVTKGSAKTPVLVDFTAKWCGPCTVLGPILEKLCKEEGVTLAKYDIDVSSEQSDHYDIKSIPAVYGFVRGKPLAKFVGNQPEEYLRKFILDLKQETAKE